MSESESRSSVRATSRFLHDLRVAVPWFSCTPLKPKEKDSDSRTFPKRINQDELAHPVVILTLVHVDKNKLSCRKNPKSSRVFRQSTGLQIAFGFCNRHSTTETNRQPDDITEWPIESLLASSKARLTNRNEFREKTTGSETINTTVANCTAN